jgi:hypothetical protein
VVVAVVSVERCRGLQHTVVIAGLRVEGRCGADLRVGEVAGLGSSDACERDAVGALPRQGGGSA